MFLHETHETPAVVRNIRVGDLGIDQVALPVLLGADRFIEEASRDKNMILLAVLQAGFKLLADACRGLDVELRGHVLASADVEEIWLRIGHAVQARISVSRSQETAVPLA